MSSAIGKALSVFNSLGELILICISVYWLVAMWMHREYRAYRLVLKTRRLIHMIIAYSIALVVIFQRSVTTLTYFWSRSPQTIQLDGIVVPIAFSRTTDKILYYLLTFSFLFFFQLKCFRLWMIRYDHDYWKEMADVEWKDQLGLRTVDPLSWFLRHRSITGSWKLMTLAFAILALLIFGIHILCDQAHLVAGQVILMLSAVIAMALTIWNMHYIQPVDDELYVQSECRYFLYIHGVFLLLWLCLLIVCYTAAQTVYVLMTADFVYALYVTVMCYFDTIQILKNVDKDWVGRRASESIDLSLEQVLETQDGFEEMMRFLVTEFSCENLLCYVEICQYLRQWGVEDRMKKAFEISRMRCELMIYGFVKRTFADYFNPLLHVMEFSDDIMAIIVAYYMRLYFGDNEYFKQHVINRDLVSILDRNDDGSLRDVIGERKKKRNADPAEVVRPEFDYFQDPEYEDEVSHYEYLMQKYVEDSAALQINISHQLRHECQTKVNIDSEEKTRLLKSVLNELWMLMKDSMTRYRQSAQCQKFVQKLEKQRRKSFV